MSDFSIQGVDIGFYVRDYGTTGAWKRLVCEETLSIDFTSDVNTTKTKCGVFKGFLIPDCKISGSGVANSQPTANEISHDEITTNMLAVTKKEFRIQDVATLGSVILLGGAGNFSQQQITFNNGEVVKFTYTMEATGTIESHES
jgi:hypothetical protein